MFAAPWQEVSTVATHPSAFIHWLGADPATLVTVSAAQAGRRRPDEIRVRPGRAFLVVTARGPARAPDLVLVDPRGRSYTTKRTRPDLAVLKQPNLGATSMTIAAPTPGIWHVRARGAASATAIDAQTLRRQTPLAIVRASVGRRAAHRKHRLRLRWSSGFAARNVRVELYISPTRRAVGQLIRKGLRASGRVSLNLRLPRRRAYVRLVASANGVPFQSTTQRLR
jgi:hypothetical protein